MTFSVTLHPSQTRFETGPDETVLDAGLRQGVGLPYGCRNGVCGSCKAKIVAGEVDYGFSDEEVLSETERADGFALLCCASARTDLTVACQEIGDAGDYPVKTLPARVQEMTLLAPDVMRLRLKMPANDTLRFRAGQYIDILLKDGQRRSFSMANAPHDDSALELHLRHVPGGVFTDHVFSTMKERDILRMNGPHGSFFLREDSPKPMVLLAGGTGFAPIKSIIEHTLRTPSTRPIHLYWGARTRADLYLHELAESWAKAHTHIRYTPVLSAATEADRWGGRTGFVHQAVLDDFADLSGAQVYACGAPVMIDAAAHAFCNERGLHATDFFSDSFSYAAAAAATA